MKGRGILLSNSNGLQANGKSLTIGDTTNQEIHFLSVISKGELKMQPLIGAQAKKLIKARATVVRLKRDINEELIKDGFKAITIKINSPNIEVDATR
ncbi:hypothetical protein [Flavobacterium cerinum]|uniref:Uncharacterized protein n=1 Tax=Flavobacterium cerinum TaxID=2502784 RepID=A0A444HED5_9FLAO|nr:hypothetical protein [Flavobacterium cerinum]RWX03357.1 hypothetical protein EPI11_00060 [Flavobacterium cerinum]